MLLVSYIRTWPLGSDEAEMALGRRWTAEEIRGDLLDTLNVAFARLSGSRLYMPELPAFANLFKELAALKDRYPRLKINLSVGGWGADGFSDMAFSQESRAEFVSDVLAWLTRHNLDGIDIDWEYPVGPEGGQVIKSRPEDAENYIHLLADLREGLARLSAEQGRTFSLTTAVPAAAWFPRTIDLVRVQEQVDYLKLMSYDLYGSWSPTTGHTANLYPSPGDPGGWSVDQAVRSYLEAGVQPEKLLLGVPFYARAWRGVPAQNHGLFQPFASGAYEHGLSYTELKKGFLTDANFARYWDEEAQAAWLYDGDLFISYEDPQALAAKAAYVREKGLAGVMIWEYCHDLSAECLKTLHAALKDA